MIRNFLLLITILFCIHTKAQEKLSYGVSVGTNVYAMLTESNAAFNPNGSFSIPEYAGLYISAYGDYQLSNYLGIITDIAYEKRTVNINPRTKLSYISISPKLKYDFNGIYDQGLYLKSGLRYSILANAETTNGLDVKEAYTNGLFSANLGIGTSLSKFLGFELILDYSFTNALDADIKSKLFGAYALLTIDIEKLIN